MPDLTGQTLGKYQITNRLGRGGMAEVYKGRHLHLERDVAVKLLHGHLAEGEDFCARFEREARAVAALRHPHIVQVYDFDVAEDRPYMVMEYVDGETLKDMLERQAAAGALPAPEEAARIFHQVAAALDYAHRSGMLHRDIKSANVLLDRAGSAYLTDFGLARLLCGGETQLTATGTLIGTPAYMSPEQGKGLELTPASDIYSLGVVLYELFTGRVPFEADTPWGVIEKHVSAPLPPLCSVQPELPSALEEVLARALAKDPAERFKTPLEMAGAVDRALGLAVAAVVPEAGEKGPPQAGPAATGSANATAGSTPSMVAAQPTIAMGAAREPEGASDVGIEEEAQPAPARPAGSFKKKKLWFIAVPLALLLIAAAVLVPMFFGGGGSPATVDYYRNRAARLAEEGKLEAAIEQVDRALGQVKAAERPAYAQLWLMRGDLFRELGDFDKARESYRRCIEWTGEDPHLQHLRIDAENRLDGLP
jgi:predicted Ser/Thr protein kinase